MLLADQPHKEHQNRDSASSLHIGLHEPITRHVGPKSAPFSRVMKYL